MHSDRAEKILGKYVRDNSVLLNRCSTAECIAEFDRVSPEAPYHHIPPEITARWSPFLKQGKEKDFAIIANAILLQLIVDFPMRSINRMYTKEIMDLFKISFSRIIDSIENTSISPYATIDDNFLKDLAICRQHVFPVGVVLVEPRSAFPRALLCRGGIMQMVRLVKLLISIGSNKPFYQIHMQLSERAEFNPSGWEQAYQRIAGMLELNPQIKGMYGSTWFYDPFLEKISPHLTYLRRQPQDNGARVFYWGVDLHGGALSKSATRRRLYNEGTYLPKSYALIWPRRAMIEWAKRQKVGEKGVS